VAGSGSRLRCRHRGRPVEDRSGGDRAFAAVITDRAVEVLGAAPTAAYVLGPWRCGRLAEQS